MRWLGALAVVAVLNVSGCATVIKGMSGRVAFQSQPPGAEVRVNGVPRGVTPLELNLDHGPTYTVVFELPGYRPYAATITSSFSGHSLWFLILYSLLFDAITGTLATLDQDLVYARLQPLPGRATAPRLAMPAPTPVPKGPELKVVVLDFTNEAGLSSYELDSLAELLRVGALSLPGERLFVFTRENLIEMLPPGTDLSKCEGACEVETGRNVGADLVATGTVGHFGGQVHVTLNLHTTTNGRLIGAEAVSAPDLSALGPALTAASQRLLRRALVRAAAGS